jgi:hypothetical protein
VRVKSTNKSNRKRQDQREINTHTDEKLGLAQDLLTRNAQRINRNTPLEFRATSLPSHPFKHETSKNHTRLPQHPYLEAPRDSATAASTADITVRPGHSGGYQKRNVRQGGRRRERTRWREQAVGGSGSALNGHQ